MKINLKPRVWSVKFWLTIVPALTLFAQTLGTPFGYHWDFVILNQQLADIINAVFGVLAVIGVVVDPTTAGVSDSEQAQSYGPLVTTKSEQIAQLQKQVATLSSTQKPVAKTVSADAQNKEETK